MTVYNAISSNKKKTLLVMIIFVAFFLTISYLIGKALGYGLAFAGVIFIVSGITTILSYYYSDKYVLSLSHAKKADKEEYKDLHNITENLCIGMGLPLPQIYVMYDMAPNAFATGRDPQHAAICVTTGLLDILKRVELEGVIAHELSHIKNFDTRLMGVVSVLVGSIALLSEVFLRSMWYRGSNRSRDNRMLILLAMVAAIIAPFVATLMQLAVSRRREYLADADGALVTRYPDGLADALLKISQSDKTVKNATLATSYFFIEDPIKKSDKNNWLTGLFNTHPPIDERVKILRAM
jgi:heat shock protein HtpX